MSLAQRVDCFWLVKGSPTSSEPSEPIAPYRSEAAAQALAARLNECQSVERFRVLPGSCDPAMYPSLTQENAP